MSSICLPRCSGEPLPWACEGRHWELPELTSGSCEVIGAPRYSPSGPAHVTEDSWSWALRLPWGPASRCRCVGGSRRQMRGRQPAGGRPGWCTVHAPCCSVAQSQFQEENRRQNFAKGPLKSSFEQSFRTSAKALETWPVPCHRLVPPGGCSWACSEGTSGQPGWALRGSASVTCAAAGKVVLPWARLGAPGFSKRGPFRGR